MASSNGSSNYKARNKTKLPKCKTHSPGRAGEDNRPLVCAAAEDAVEESAVCTVREECFGLEVCRG